MAAEHVVLSAIGEFYEKSIELRGSLLPMVIQDLVSEDAGFPAMHSPGHRRNQVDTTVLAWLITPNIGKRLAPKELTLSGDILDVGEPIVVLQRIVPRILDVIRTCNAETWIGGELPQEVFDVVPIE